MSWAKLLLLSPAETVAASKVVEKLQVLISEGDANLESICGPQDKECLQFDFQKGIRLQLESAKEVNQLFRFVLAQTKADDLNKANFAMHADLDLFTIRSHNDFVINDLGNAKILAAYIKLLPENQKSFVQNLKDLNQTLDTMLGLDTSGYAVGLTKDGIKLIKKRIQEILFDLK